MFLCICMAIINMREGGRERERARAKERERERERERDVFHFKKKTVMNVHNMHRVGSGFILIDIKIVIIFLHFLLIIIAWR